MDTETGQVELLRIVAVDDAGTIINPLVAEGQVHGGVATGVAQALYEDVHLRRGRQPADGQPSSATRFPSAADLPSWEVGRDGDADAG